MKRIFTTFLLIGLTFSIVFAQANENKSYRRYIKQGDRYYEAFAYIKAIAKYTKAFESFPNQSYPKLRLADSYRMMNQPEPSEKWYALAADSEAFSDQNKLDYAQVLMKNGKYSQAQEVIRSIENPLAANSQLAKKVKATENQSVYYLDSAVYGIQRTNLNTSDSDFGPTYYNDGIIFSSARKPPRLANRKYDWDDSYFLNLYYADFQNGVLSRPEYFSKRINTVFHEGPSAFFAGEQKMIFTRNNYYKGRTDNSEEGVNTLNMYLVEMKEGGKKWGKVVPFEYNSSEYSVGHPTLSSDNSTMYFVSDMPGTKGGSDIFVTYWEGNKWSTPESLGQNINTPANEMFPFLFEDKTLYFASDGHNGLGGLDLYKVDLADSVELLCTAEDGSLEYCKVALTDRNLEVENLGYPMNSEKDDFGLILRGDEGFFSSNRDGGVGSDDIYQFQIFQFTIEPQLVDGRSLDPLTGDLKIFDLTSNRLIASVSGAKSTTFNALRGREYAIAGATSGYLDNTINFTPTSLPEDEASFVVPVPLYRVEKFNAVIVINNEMEDQLFYGNEQLVEYDGTSKELTEYLKGRYGQLEKVDTVRNIYYDFDKSNIREDAARELDRLVELLSSNEELKISLSAHTDKRGSNPYNDKLADRRVESARKYLEEKGIAPERISIDSFGEYRLFRECVEGEDCNEPTHQSNRRTEIRLTSTKGKMAMR